MKKRIFLLMAIILAINLASGASFECSDGNPVIEARKGVNTADIESINGINIGLTDSSISEVLNKIAADLIIDAKKYTLTSANNITIIKLKIGEYNLSLLNYSDSNVGIGVDGDSDTVDERNTKSIKGLAVYVTSIDISESGDATVNGLIGESKISLSNDDNPYEIISHNNASYVMEISSASFTYASINVVKCKDKNATITVITEEPEPVEDTSDTTTNATGEESTSNTTNISSETANETQESEVIEEAPVPERKISLKIILIIIGIFVASFVLFYFIKMMKGKVTSPEISSEEVDRLRGS